MTRVFSVTILTIIASALWQSIALSLPSFLNSLMLPPIILAFSLQYFKPFESVLIALWCGAIVDILGGHFIGVNMLLSIGFFFLLSASNIFSARLSLSELSIYIAVLSFVYRLFFFFLMAILFGQKANIYIIQLFFGPLMDSLISFPFNFLLQKILIALKAVDQHDVVRKIGANS